MKTLQQLNFDNSYARLPSVFFPEQQPEPLVNSYLVHFKRRAAELIELDPEQVKHPAFVDIMTCRQPLPGFQLLALCYAGHQFGYFVPRLGDGRALLLGEVKTDKGKKWILHLKGACDAWIKKYRSRLNAESCRAEQRSRKMKWVNPKYILRNHLAETARRKARNDADYSEIDPLMTVLQNPFDEKPDCVRPTPNTRPPGYRLSR